MMLMLNGFLSLQRLVVLQKVFTAYSKLLRFTDLQSINSLLIQPLVAIYKPITHGLSYLPFKIANCNNLHQKLEKSLTFQSSCTDQLHSAVTEEPEYTSKQSHLATSHPQKDKNIK